MRLQNKMKRTDKVTKNMEIRSKEMNEKRIKNKKTNIAEMTNNP